MADVDDLVVAKIESCQVSERRQWTDIALGVEKVERGQLDDMFEAREVLNNVVVALLASTARKSLP